MSSNNLDRQPEERLVNEIRSMRRELSENRTLQLQGQSAVQLHITEDVSGSITLPSDGMGLWACRFESDTTDVVFSMFEFTLYWNSVHPDSIIAGNSWLLTIMYPFSTWRSHVDADGPNQVDNILIENLSSFTQTIWIVGRWRYAVSSGQGSSSASEI